jgi:hypothetical protein
MLRTEYTVETLGEPDLTALSESEQRTFFDTLLSAILELAKPVT